MRMRDMIGMMKAKNRGLRGFAAGGILPEPAFNLLPGNMAEAAALADDEAAIRGGQRGYSLRTGVNPSGATTLTDVSRTAGQAAPEAAPGRLARAGSKLGSAGRWVGARVLPAAAAYTGVRTGIEAAREGTTPQDVSIADEALQYDPIQRALGPDSKLGEVRRAIAGGMTTAGRRALNIGGGLVGAGTAGDTIVGGIRDMIAGDPEGTTKFEQTPNAPVAKPDFADNWDLQGPQGIRQYAVPGAPGIIRRDEKGKTPLYTDGSEGGRVSTIQTSDIAPKQAAQLTAAISARLASNDPADREFARKLAVTPEHQAMIAKADAQAKMDPQERLARDTLAAQERIEGLRTDVQRGARDAQVARLMYDINKDNRDFQVSERDKAIARETEGSKEVRTVVDEIFPGDEKKDPSVGENRSAFIQFLQSSRPTVRVGDKDVSIFSLPRAQLQQVMQRELPKFEQQQAARASISGSMFTSNNELGIRGYDPPIGVRPFEWRDVTRGSTVGDVARGKFVPFSPNQVVTTKAGAAIPVRKYVTTAEQRAALEAQGIRLPK